jgi:hypothetical protein
VNGIKYFFSGNAPVVFVPQVDGGLRVMSYGPNAQTFSDARAYWRLIEFDRDDLAREVTLEEMEEALRDQAIPVDLLYGVIFEQNPGNPNGIRWKSVDTLL